MKLHVNWARASERHPKRVLVDAAGDSQGLPGRVREALQQRDVCRAFERAPYLLVPGTSSVSSFKKSFK